MVRTASVASMALLGRTLVMSWVLLAPVQVLGDRHSSPSRTGDDLETLRAVESSIVDVVQMTTSAVVFITGGSGVCISSDGTILTNDHVVGKRDFVLVRFAHTGERRRARLLGRFPAGDISLLKIEDEGPYPHLEFGDSDMLVPGQRVVALGNPFLLAVGEFFVGAPPNFHPSVSMGVVSALHRNSPPRYSDAIQVDVAVNPGNSGGPLVNLQGKLIGINGKIETRFHLGVNSGVGYAIPSNQIVRFVEPLRKAGGKVIKHGKILGVEVENRVRPDGPGLPVKRVAKNSAAAAAGLLRGDRILSIDDHPIPTRSRFEGILQTFPIGSTVTIKVLRDSQNKEILTTLVSPDTEKPVRLGISFDSDAEAKGRLKVSTVFPGSPAERADIRVGDVLLRFDNLRDPSFYELRSRIGKKKPGDVVIIRVRRGKNDIDIPLLLQSYESE